MRPVKIISEIYKHYGWVYRIIDNFYKTERELPNTEDLLINGRVQKLENPVFIADTCNTVFSWLIYKSIFSFKKEKMLSLIKKKITHIAPDCFATLPFCVYVEIDKYFDGIGDIAGFWARTEDRLLSILLDIKSEDPDEIHLLRMVFPLDAKNITNGLRRCLAWGRDIATVREKRSSLCFVVHKDEGTTVRTARRQIQNIYEYCLRLLIAVTGIVGIPQQPPKPRNIEYRDAPKKRYKEVKDRAVKTWSDGVRSVYVRKPGAPEIRYRNYKGTGKGRRHANNINRRPHGRWQPYGPRKDEKGDPIEQKRRWIVCSGTRVNPTKKTSSPLTATINVFKVT